MCNACMGNVCSVASLVCSKNALSSGEALNICAENQAWLQVVKIPLVRERALCKESLNIGLLI